MRQVLGPDKGIVFDDLLFVVFQDFIHLLNIDFHIFLEVVLLYLIAEAFNVGVVFSLEECDLLLDLFANFRQILMLDMLLLYAFLSSFCDQFIKERVDFLNDGFSFEIERFYVRPGILFGLVQLTPSLQSFLKDSTHLVLDVRCPGYDFFQVLELHFDVLGMILGVFRKTGGAEWLEMPCVS